MKETFDQMNTRIIPDENLNSKVLDQAITPATAPHRFRPLVVVAAVLVLVLAATPVIADCIPWVLERIAPHLAQTYDPVLLSDTDNGITLEIVGATVQDNVVELVMKYQGDALAGPNGVAPYFDIGAMGCNAITLNVLRDYEGYWNDITSGTYYSQVLLTYPEDITGERILNAEIAVILDKIHISGFASDQLEIPLIFTDPARLTVTTAAELKKQGFTNFGEGVADEYASMIDPGSCVILPTGEQLYAVNEKLSLSSAAYIDGMLHIQLAALEVNSGFADWNYRGPLLLDSCGNEISALYSNLFSKDNTEYREYVFDISREELENCTLSVQLEYHEWIPCNCQVTFHVHQAEGTGE